MVENYVFPTSLDVFTFFWTGGYKLELLDDSDTVVRTLVDTTSSNLEGKVEEAPAVTTFSQFFMQRIANFFQLEDQSATVTFEVGEECSDCTLRLERQAAEFSNYYFHSCADIRVVPLGVINEKRARERKKAEPSVGGAEMHFIQL